MTVTRCGTSRWRPIAFEHEHRRGAYRGATRHGFVTGTVYRPSAHRGRVIRAALRAAGTGCFATSVLRLALRSAARLHVPHGRVDLHHRLHSARLQRLLQLRFQAAGVGPGVNDPPPCWWLRGGMSRRGRLGDSGRRLRPGGEVCRARLGGRRRQGDRASGGRCWAPPGLRPRPSPHAAHALGARRGVLGRQPGLRARQRGESRPPRRALATRASARRERRCREPVDHLHRVHLLVPPMHRE